MSEQPPQRPTDRSRKPPARLRRHTFTFRITSGLRARLSAAAAAEGRSVSETIEHRLEQSLQADELLGVDGNRLRRLGHAAGALLQSLELMTGRTAFGPEGHPWLHNMVWETFNVLFDATRPPGDRAAPEDPALAAQLQSAFELFLDLASAELPTAEQARHVRQRARRARG
jgi:hypothetical protein